MYTSCLNNKHISGGTAIKIISLVFYLCDYARPEEQHCHRSTDSMKQRALLHWLQPIPMQLQHQQQRKSLTKINKNK